MHKLIRSAGTWLFNTVKRQRIITVKYPGPNIDTTALIQKAINNNTHVIIPKGDWMVSTPPDVGPIIPDGTQWAARYAIALKSNLTLTINGTIIAKQGSFLGVNDCLMGGDKVFNTIISGKGTLKMQKSEYTTGEGRHCLQLRGCSNVTITGLTFRDSGGDGLYIGPIEDARRAPCVNVQVVGCIFDSNRRQGISVLSAINSSIKSCKIYRTQGTAPQAAIDIEPEHPRDQIINFRIQDCLMQDNQGSGIVVSMSKYLMKTPISLWIDNVQVIGCKQAAFRFILLPHAGPESGIIDVRNCSGEDIPSSGITCTWDMTRNYTLNIVNFKFDRVARDVWVESNKALELNLTGDGSFENSGITFDNVVVIDRLDRKLTYVKSTIGVVTNVRGVIFLKPINYTPVISQTQELLPNLHFQLL